MRMAATAGVSGRFSGVGCNTIIMPRLPLNSAAKLRSRLKFRNVPLIVAGSAIATFAALENADPLGSCPVETFNRARTVDDDRSAAVFTYSLVCSS